MICIFCLTPASKETNDASICMSSRNFMKPDTAGNRHHLFEDYSQRAKDAAQRAANSTQEVEFFSVSTNMEFAAMLIKNERLQCAKDVCIFCAQTDLYESAAFIDEYKWCHKRTVTGQFLRCQASKIWERAAAEQGKAKIETNAK